MFTENIEKEFYGFEKYFVEKHADCVYVSNLQKREAYEELFDKNGIQAEVVSNIDELSGRADVLIGFHIPNSGTYNVENYHGRKLYCVDDHHMRSLYKRNYLRKIKADGVIAYGQLDRDSAFFDEMYSDFVGRVIAVPIGYSTRYKNIKPFNMRIHRAVGLGSINKVNDQMQKSEDMKPVVEFFKGRIWTHETRKYIQDHANELSDCIDALFPPPEKQKDFSYDPVERLNNYQIFVNDAGNFNFPPIRTYEGIACGCVMAAADNRIYYDLGFKRDVNYIGFTEGDYDEMAHNIRYYLSHQEELLRLQSKSLELAKC